MMSAFDGRAIGRTPGVATLQPDQRDDDKSLDVFDDKADGEESDPSIRSANLPEDTREAEAQPGFNPPDLNLGGSADQSEDPASIFTDTGNDLDLQDDEVQASEPDPKLNLDEKDGDEKGEAGGKDGEDGGDGSEDPEPENDPPLESVDLPDLTFDGPDPEPPLASNDLPDVTYGSTSEESDLVEADLPEITFGSPENEEEDEIVESVEAPSGSEAVIFEDDDAAVILDDSSSGADEAEAGPAPDYPEPEDDENQTGFGAGADTYEIAAVPWFAHHDFTLVYADPDDEDDGDDVDEGM
jgi:hypothetical protein